MKCLCVGEYICISCEREKIFSRESEIKLKAFKKLYRYINPNEFQKFEMNKLFLELVSLNAGLFDKEFLKVQEQWNEFRKSPQIQLIKPPQKTAKMEGSDELPF